MNLIQDLIGTKLFIGDLAAFCDEGRIQEIFRSHGFDTYSIRLMRGKQSLASLNYGFVELKTKEDAARAIAELDQKMVHGRKLRVKWAAPNIRSENPIKSANSIRVKFNSLKVRAETTVTEEILRQVFSLPSELSNRTSGEYDIGYGFVHFTKSDEGMTVAFNAVKETRNGPITYNHVEYVCEPSKSLIYNAHRVHKEHKQLKFDRVPTVTGDVDLNSTINSFNYLSSHDLSLDEFYAPCDQIIREETAYESAATKQYGRRLDSNDYDKSYTTESMTYDSSIRCQSLTSGRCAPMLPVAQTPFPDYLDYRCTVSRPPGFPPSENEHKSMETRKLAIRLPFPDSGADPHSSLNPDRAYQSPVDYQNENCFQRDNFRNDYPARKSRIQVAFTHQPTLYNPAVDRDYGRHAVPVRSYERAVDWDYELAGADEQKNFVGLSCPPLSKHNYASAAVPSNKSCNHTVNSDMSYARGSKAESWIHDYDRCSNVLLSRSNMPLPYCNDDCNAKPLPSRSYDNCLELDHTTNSTSLPPHDCRLTHCIRSQEPHRERHYAQSADPRPLSNRPIKQSIRAVDKKTCAYKQNETRLLRAFGGIGSCNLIGAIEGYYSYISTESSRPPEISVNSGPLSFLCSQELEGLEDDSRPVGIVDNPVSQPTPSGLEAHNPLAASENSVGAASYFINMAASAGQSVHVDMRSYMGTIQSYGIRENYCDRYL